MSKKFNHFETNAIRTQIERSEQKEHSSPIFPSSSFIFDSSEEARDVFAETMQGNVYSRFDNPSVDEFVNKMCLLEGYESGIATSTGMSAIFLSLVSFLRAGDHIVSSRSIFGSTHAIFNTVLSRWGITHTYVDYDDKEEWQDAIMPSTRILFAETPSNPALDLNDLHFLAELANENNCLLVVDNSFASPYVQRPVEFGAHLVCHSGTKFIDGQGRVMGGIVLGEESLIKEVRAFSRQIGPTLSPFNAWILSKSLETLAVRMEKHCDNALKLAQHLQQSKGIKTVKYPFLDSHPQVELAKKQMKLGGGMVSFELEGGPERCMRFINELKMLSISSNLGDTRTIITHPSTTTHSKLTEDERLAVGITQSLVRVSVGLEHIEDIVGDIEEALEESK